MSEGHGAGPVRSGALVLLRHKVLASVAIAGAAASIAGLGTFGTFTWTSQASTPVSSGTIKIDLGTPGTAANRLTLGATGMIAGDTMSRALDLLNTGDQDLASVGLTATATTSSALDTDTTNGLQLAITRCSQAWTETGSSPAFSYTCGGTTSTVLASTPVIGSFALSNLTALTAGTTDHLRVVMTFPSTADSTMRNLSSTVQFTFLGTQRAGTAK